MAGSAEPTTDQDNTDHHGDNAKENKAASLLQKQYRGYRSKREAAGLNIETSRGRKDTSQTKDSSTKPDEGGNQSQDSNDPSTQSNNAEEVSSNDRWNDALASGGMANASKEQDQGKNDSKSRWQRSGMYATRITGTDGRQEQGNDEGQSREAKAKALAPNKQMEAQYWLEMIDSKHRYGANLKGYHDAWNKSDTSDNFFHWLDHGEGRHLDLDDCPREQLDKEQVLYLNAEQRKNYLVEVHDGHLHWKRNNIAVDTAKNRWEDLGKGRGIGRKGEKAKLDGEKGEGADGDDDAANDAASSSSSESSLYSSSDSDAERTNFKEKHYNSKPGQGESKRKYWTSPKMVMDVVLRKTINANTWIYVCTTTGDLYIGIKSTGGFQHSSFIYGATVASAGLIKVKNGQLTSLSPLSGHYRAGTVHFKQFLKTLREKGVDMSAVSVSKSVFIIRGIEKYAKVSKKKKSLKERLAHKLHITTKAEKKEAEEKERNDEIEQKARQGAGKETGNQNSHDHSASDNDDAVTGNMHDGKRKEDLTEDERAERAIALIQSAISKGLKSKGEGNESSAKAQDTSNRPSKAAAQ